MSCQCFSELKPEECCQPYLKGEMSPPTAASLMRSRYTAFATGNIDYIVETHHPDKRHEVDQEEIKVWSENSEWEGLEIIETHKGTEKDSEGVVEFVAKYRIKGRLQTHHEVAEFQKVDGKWYFYDGQLQRTTYVREAPKVGRNDPCTCGSGKKFKKCCGR